MIKKHKTCLSRLLTVFSALLGLCLLLALASMVSNRDLPGEASFDTLSPIEKARLLETLHLKSTHGNHAWQGWGSAEIPVIVWNRSYEFLTNYDGATPSGWSRVTNDDLNGQVYF